MLNICVGWFLKRGNNNVDASSSYDVIDTPQRASRHATGRLHWNKGIFLSGQTRKEWENLKRDNIEWGFQINYFHCQSEIL